MLEAVVPAAPNDPVASNDQGGARNDMVAAAARCVGLCLRARVRGCLCVWGQSGRGCWNFGRWNYITTLTHGHMHTLTPTHLHIGYWRTDLPKRWTNTPRLLRRQTQRPD